jgi:hypothetical protein
MSYFPTTESHPDVQERNAQAPLGEHPSYDDLLDVAVQYTFPCSDPIAVQSDASARQQREEGQARGPGTGPGHGEQVPL